MRDFKKQFEQETNIEPYICDSSSDYIIWLENKLEFISKYQARTEQDAQETVDNSKRAAATQHFLLSEEYRVRAEERNRIAGDIDRLLSVKISK